MTMTKIAGKVVKKAEMKTDRMGKAYVQLTIEENKMKLDNGSLKRTGRNYHHVAIYGNAMATALGCQTGDIVSLAGRYQLSLRRCKNTQQMFRAETLKKYNNIAA